MMAPVMSPETQLSRMEDARRQTQRQLELIDRQITRRMTAILPKLARRQTGYHRGKAPDGRTLLERYRANLAGLTAERQPEAEPYQESWLDRTLRSQRYATVYLLPAHTRVRRADDMATIGDLERNAGIGSSNAERTAFWLRFHHLEGKACLDAGVAELKRMIAERNGTELRAAKHRRQQWPAPSDDQEAALQAYAARHGRRWKSILSDVWMGGGPPYDDGGILRGLRNTHGPTWLQSYRLPKAVFRSQSDGNAAVSHVGIGKSEE
nr:hypothetical protein [Rhizobium ruizarguesonis]